MRKFLAILLSAVTVLTLAFVGVSAEATVISTAEDFAAMAADGNYKLGADLTISATYTTEFTGTLDGDGHTLTISVPVFKSLKGATVKNLTLKGSVTEATSANTAALSLTTFGGTFENITNEADVNHTYALADATKNEAVRTGGIVAHIRTTAATFTNCINKGNVSGAEATGGIVGESQTTDTTLTNCANYGTVSVPVSKNSGVAGGGLLGYSGTGNVNYINCTNYGDVVTDYRGGGIAGDARKGAVCTGCVNYGKITGTDTCGGIIGYDGDSSTATATVLTKCINFGEICASENQAGGLVGYVYASGSKSYVDLEYCINNGKVSAGKFCSEFVGYSNSWNNTIKNSIGVGELATVTVENFPTIVAIMGCSSTQPASMNIENVYIADNGVTQWLTWAAFATNTKVTPNISDCNAQNRIPLSACLGKDLENVEYEYPVYSEAIYTTPLETVKTVASSGIGATENDALVGIRVKAITRIELSDATVKAFADKTGFEVYLKDGQVLMGTPDTPTTGDTVVWVAVVALVSVLGMGIAIKTRKDY